MKPKMKIKMGIDLLMTVLLLCLMAYQITGQELHEWIGICMLILFVVHNILNFRWYISLFRGKYKPVRIMQTIINSGALIAMLCLGFSGMIMSRYVFRPFSINGPMATARRMHMAASYWGFVLMSMHLGMHWGMIIGIFRRILKGSKLPRLCTWGLRLAAILLAGYGLNCFIQKDIVSYMFLQKQFVFFAFEQSTWSVFMEYMAMMGLGVWVGYYVVKGIGLISDMAA